MAEDKKNNRVTRYHDEAVCRIKDTAQGLRNQARFKKEEASVLTAQAEVLISQVDVMEELLARGNYENGKDEKGGS